VRRELASTELADTQDARTSHERHRQHDRNHGYRTPNLPETHLTLGGGEAAGIVFAINPLLKPAAIGQLLNAGEAKVLVTVAPFPGVDPWSKVQPILGEVPSLRHVVLVDLLHDAPRSGHWTASSSQQREETGLCGNGVSAAPVAVHRADVELAGRVAPVSPTRSHAIRTKQ
jgi:fatty-acyl-CoA synthase